MVDAKQKIATMKELSEAIGVSRPTLSRYFQDPSSVRDSTSRKIKERLKDVDYVYNFIATRQNRKSSGLIGVIIPHYKDLFFSSLLEAIETAARNTGFTVITQSSDGSAQGEIQAIARLRSMNADGAIIAPLGAKSSTEALQRAREDFPIVFVDSRPAEVIEDTDFIGTDNVQSITSIVEYLCRTGDAPVFLAMPELNSNAYEREAAYREKMIELGYEPKFVKAEKNDQPWQFEAYGFGVMDNHFGRHHHLSDTILCANDRIAIGAICAANKHGLLPHKNDQGGRLRIAGHDDHPLSKYTFPAITTVGQDIDGIGHSAFELMIARIGNEVASAPADILKETVLRIRDST